MSIPNMWIEERNHISKHGNVETVDLATLQFTSQLSVQDVRRTWTSSTLHNYVSSLIHGF